MAGDLPPSGAWAGYYLYGAGGGRHPMHLLLTFPADGRIDGEGIDDIARFLIDGSFDRVTSTATWVKAYVGMHTVAYSGLYGGKTIRGDWSLGPATGGFCIWPAGRQQNESAVEKERLPHPVTV